MSTLKLVQEKIPKVYNDLEFLLLCLKEVLIESGEKELANDIPWISEQIDFNRKEFTEKHLKFVITSYSIHYTKLYENRIIL